MTRYLYLWLPTSVNHMPLLNGSLDTETFRWRPTRPSVPKRLSWREWRRWKQTYKTARRNINGCSLLGDKGRIRRTGQGQGNTTGTRKHERKRQTRQEQGNAAGQWEREPTTAGITETHQITRQWLKKSLKQIKTSVEGSCEENKKTPEKPRKHTKQTEDVCLLDKKHNLLLMGNCLLTLSPYQLRYKGMNWNSYCCRLIY